MPSWWQPRWESSNSSDQYIMRRIEQTADGSYTLFVPEMNEHYHSIKGALTESEHIFIHEGLNACQAVSPHVLEIGFGTGLNAFLTLLEAEKTLRNVSFTTLERYPVAEELLHQLHYPEQINPAQADLYYALHHAAWDESIDITSHFALRKIAADFTQYTFTEQYDVIYFDAFAPEKQPEMWSHELFAELYHHTRLQGILTTYCAKGIIRRTLQAVGFEVERLPGPPGGKREILRARKL